MPGTERQVVPRFVQSISDQLGRAWMIQQLRWTRGLRNIEHQANNRVRTIKERAINEIHRRDPM